MDARTSARLDFLLTACYYSLLPQFVLTPIAAALMLNSRKRLWEYFFHFHFCLTPWLFAALPLSRRCARSPTTGLNPLSIKTRFITQFQALREGLVCDAIRFDDSEGLISMPSFHAAGAMIVTWTFRGHRRWLGARGAAQRRTSGPPLSCPALITSST